METPAQNSLAVLDNGIIELTQRGYQTAESVGQFQSQIDSMTKKLHAEGKKVLIMVNMTGVTGHDAAAREEGKARIKGDYDAMAICGMHTALRLIVNWLIRITHSEHVQLFDDRQTALTWLQQNAA